MRTRKNARVILINEFNEIYLFKFHFEFLQEDKTLWVTPGGGVEEGETFEEGLQRELYEELGLDIIIDEPYAFFRRIPFISASGEEFISDERYFIIKDFHETISFDHMSSGEMALTKDGRWWSADDISSSDEEFFAEDLEDILNDIINDALPNTPQEI